MFLTIIKESMNIDVNKSEFSYTEDYDIWASTVDSIRPKYLKSYKLKFLTTPISSYYDKFLVAKSRKGTLTDFKKILDEDADDVVLYKIENSKYVGTSSQAIKLGCVFRYGLISEASTTRIL